METIKRITIKTVALLLSLAMISVLTSCGKSGDKHKILIEDIDEALVDYKCTNDNMFGLEEIAVFEDHVTAVFDKDINDSSEYNNIALGKLKQLASDKKPRVYIRPSNLSGYDHYGQSVEKQDGKYIVTSYLKYEEYNVIDSLSPIFFIGFGMDDCYIDFNGGDLTLTYTLYGGECIEKIIQDYDCDDEMWSDIRLETTVVPEDICE